MSTNNISTKDTKEYIKHIFKDTTNKVMHKLQYVEQEVGGVFAYELSGRVISALGTTIVAYLPNAKIGDLCLVYDDIIELKLYAEVVAIDNHQVKLLPLGLSLIHI